MRSSFDYNLDLSSFSDKLLADMAGNACNGVSFGKAIVAAFATSATAPRTRIRRMFKAADDIEETLATRVAKRYKPSTGLGALLALV